MGEGYGPTQEAENRLYSNVSSLLDRLRVLEARILKLELALTPPGRITVTPGKMVDDEACRPESNS